MGKRSWRCFFCDAVFTREQDAAEHFGELRTALPACQLKGSDLGLLGIIREQESDLARFRAEDSDLVRVMQQMQSEHAENVRRAEEDGYGKAVRDMQALALKQFGREVAI